MDFTKIENRRINKMTQRKEKNPLQVIRLDGRNVFLEVMNAFQIGKVQINFIEYDAKQEKNSRIKNEIRTFIDFDKFLVLINDVKSGRMSALAKKAREEQAKGGYKFCKEIYADMGGISARNLEQRGQARPDGKSMSRQFKITPGDKMPWILSGETGAGIEDDKGLIVPQGRPEITVRVPLSDDDFKKLALVVEMHMQAYLSSFYVQLAQQEKDKEKQTQK